MVRTVLVYGQVESAPQEGSSPGTGQTFPVSGRRASVVYFCDRACVRENAIYTTRESLSRRLELLQFNYGRPVNSRPFQQEALVFVQQTSVCELTIAMSVVFPKYLMT